MKIIFNKIIRNVIGSIGLTFISSQAFAQVNQLDSLKNEINSNNPAKKRIESVMLFCSEWDSYSPDTLWKYANLASRLVNRYGNEKQKLRTNYFLAAYYFQENKLDSAQSLLTSAFAKYKRAFSFDENYISFYRLQSNIFLRKSMFDENMQNNLSLLQIAEKANDTLGIANANMGVGNTYNLMQRKREAIDWYLRALNLLTNDKLRSGLSQLYINLAIAYYKLQSEDSSFYYVRKGVEYSAKSNLTNYANALAVYAGLLAEFNKPEEAETAFKNALEARKKIGDSYYIISDMAQFALFYLNTKQPLKGAELCKEGVVLAQKNNIAPGDDLYETMARCYIAAGDYKNATETLQQLLTLKDSVYAKNLATGIAEMQTKYEVQKKEAEIAQQHLSIVKKNYLIYGSVVVLLLLVLLTYQFFRRYQQKQHFQLHKAVENEKQLSAKAVNEAEENERKRIAADLHDNLGAQANALLYGTEQLKNSVGDEPELLDNLQYTARDMMQSLRETSWAMKHSEVTSADIWIRIINFSKRLDLVFSNIKISTNGDADTKMKFSSTRALQIILIIQEAVNNSVRHSGAERITVTSKNYENEWELSVQDNGSGFDVSSIQNDGIGLVNMKERAEKAGIILEIKSVSRSGTIIDLQIPADYNNPKEVLAAL